MTRVLPALLLLMALETAVEPQSNRIVIVGATIIDGTDRAPIRDGAIIIENGRIAAIGPRGRVPSRSVTLDAKGKWIIPGLIDAHVHFFQSAGIYTRPDVVDLRKQRPYTQELEWIRDRLPMTFSRYLASGVTGVVDVGGPMWNFEVRDLARRSPLAPHIAVAGPLVSTYAPPNLVGDTSDPAIIKADTPEEARTLVRRQLSDKPDLIKIWFVLRPGDNFGRQVEMVRATIDESHKNGIRVAVHATELAAAMAAVEAGADILVHSVADRRVDREFINLVKQKDVLYMSTLVVNEGYREVLNQEVQLTEIEKKLGDPEVIQSWAELGRIPPDDIPGGLRRRPAREARPVSFENLMLLDAAEVRIVGATDAGNIGTLHGPALHREFELMAEAGMTPARILRSATRHAAAVMGREKELGTLEMGKAADLVILDANPLENIRNTQKIFRVMKGGQWIESTPPPPR